jgi:hypothetical protein
MLHPLRVTRERRPTNRAAQFILTRHEIGSRPQPVARRALHLVRGLIAEARQFVGHSDKPTTIAIDVSSSMR